LAGEVNKENNYRRKEVISLAKLVALIEYETLVAGALKEEEYHFPGLKNVKVAGVVINPVPDKQGNVIVLFPEDFGGEITVDCDALEYIVLPDKAKPAI